MLSKSFFFVIFSASFVAAAPIGKRQGAGVGAGCNSVFSDTDTTLGDITQSEGESISKKLGGGLGKRQGAGVGAGCDSLFSDTDTTLGDFTQSEGESIAKKLGGGTLGRRQLNGIGYGLTDVTGSLPGLSSSSDQLGSELNDIDGEGTQGSANAGESIGNAELSAGKALETATGAQDSYSNGGAHSSTGGNGGSGNTPPPAKGPHKRQANGIGYGISDVVAKLPGGASPADTLGNEINTIDGETTDGSAQAGKALGDFELNAGKSLETLTGAEDSYSNGGAHSS